MGCRMSPKLNMLHLHLAFCKSNMGAYLEEHGERFQRDVLVFEKSYQVEYNARMMEEYIWGLVRDTKQQYRRKCRKSKCLE